MTVSLAWISVIRCSPWPCDILQDVNISQPPLPTATVPPAIKIAEQTSQKPQATPEPSPLTTNLPIESMDDPPSPIMEDPPTPDLPPAALPAIYDPGYPPAGNLGDMSSLFNPEVMQMFQGAGGGQEGASPFAPRQKGPAVKEEKPLVVRLMPVVHMLAITVMFYLTVFVWEPSVWASGAGRSSLAPDWKVGAERAGRWRSLMGDTGVASDILTSGFASLVCLLNDSTRLLLTSLPFAACLLGFRHAGDIALQHRNPPGSGTFI